MATSKPWSPGSPGSTGYAIYGESAGATAVIGIASDSGNGVVGFSNGGTALYGYQGDDSGNYAGWLRQRPRRRERADKADARADRADARADKAEAELARVKEQVRALAEGRPLPLPGKQVDFGGANGGLAILAAAIVYAASKLASKRGSA
jgi:hypothetical protein